MHFLRIFENTLGWMSGNDIRTSVPPTECQIYTPDYFDLTSFSRKTYLEKILQTYTDLARDLKVTLVVVFQPVACTVGTGKGNAKAREVIARFKENNPDVEIPFPLIETWPSELFSVPAHVKGEHTDLIGDRLGKAMAEIISRRGI